MKRNPAELRAFITYLRKEKGDIFVAVVKTLAALAQAHTFPNHPLSIMLSQFALRDLCEVLNIDLKEIEKYALELDEGDENEKTPPANLH